MDGDPDDLFIWPLPASLFEAGVTVEFKMSLSENGVPLIPMGYYVDVADHHHVFRSKQEIKRVTAWLWLKMKSTPWAIIIFPIKMVIWSMYPIFRQTQIVQEKTWGLMN